MRPRGDGKGTGASARLNTFDVTSLVVGSIIGADVYVATAIGARLVGPSSLLVWVLAGAMAMVIALSFSYCVMILPRVGGPYAYVKAVAGPFPGFIVGWGLLLAEWFSLAVFPVAFTQYFLALDPGIDDLGKAVLKAVFIAIILLTNLVGIKAAGRVNDVLTVAKLSPLLLIVLGGFAFVALQPGQFAGNLVPFFTGDVSAFGRALVLIFWAYAGFELSTLPTDEVIQPRKTIPRAILMGMVIVIAFYFLTNFFVIGTVGSGALGASSSPLVDAARATFSSPALLTSVIVLVVGVGALLSITGADESGTVGTSRLAYAMSIDGLLPEVFSRKQKRSHTPYLGLIILCVTAYVASLMGTLADLISSAVFLLAFVYFATCLSTIFLERNHPRLSSELRWKVAIPVVGMFFSVVLIGLVSPRLIGISLILLAIGIPIYAFFSPQKELVELKDAFWSAEAVSRRAYQQGQRFLAYPLRAIKRVMRRRPAS
ncbi:MAG: amino acid permease [Methanobacteriota archaeon]|nr:MAG: amino acid permease [Euryarchaeota archaeon]